jgi:hypothetical protein
LSPVDSELPASEFEFDGQVRHVELLEVPTVGEYAPVPQSVHTSEPFVTLYFPATHSVHTPPSDPESDPETGPMYAWWFRTGPMGAVAPIDLVKMVAPELVRPNSFFGLLPYHDFWKGSRMYREN